MVWRLACGFRSKDDKVPLVANSTLQSNLWEGALPICWLKGEADLDSPDGAKRVKAFRCRPRKTLLLHRVLHITRSQVNSER